MAGHMGNVRVTTLNLEVVETDKDRGLVLVRGAVPGTKGGWVLVRDAVKRPLPKEAPKPGSFRKREGCRDRQPPPSRRRSTSGAEAMKAAVKTLDAQSAGEVELERRHLRARAAQGPDPPHGALSARSSAWPARTMPRTGRRSR